MNSLSNDIKRDIKRVFKPNNGRIITDNDTENPAQLLLDGHTEIAKATILSKEHIHTLGAPYNKCDDCGKEIDLETGESIKSKLSN